MSLLGLDWTRSDTWHTVESMRACACACPEHLRQLIFLASPKHRVCANVWPSHTHKCWQFATLTDGIKTHPHPEDDLKFHFLHHFQGSPTSTHNRGASTSSLGSPSSGKSVGASPFSGTRWGQATMSCALKGWPPAVNFKVKERYARTWCFYLFPPHKTDPPKPNSCRTVHNDVNDIYTNCRNTDNKYFLFWLCKDTEANNKSNGHPIQYLRFFAPFNPVAFRGTSSYVNIACVYPVYTYSDLFKNIQ